MKIALIGYGKMGREIEAIALQRGHTIIHKIDIDNRHLLQPETLQQADVAIEFTSPHTAVSNIKACIEATVPVVVGSTGWYDKFEEVKALCEANNSTLFYATNFSLGVNIFFELNKKLAQLMNTASG